MKLKFAELRNASIHIIFYQNPFINKGARREKKKLNSVDFFCELQIKNLQLHSLKMKMCVMLLLIQKNRDFDFQMILQKFFLQFQ